MRGAIEQATVPFAPPPVQTTQEFVDEATARVDQTLGLIYVMLGLSIVIALMGIANTLSLSIHERVRELGLVRAVGADRAQVRSMVRWESVMISVLGTVGGIGLGLFLGWGLVQAANRGEFPITFALPTSQLVPIAGSQHPSQGTGCGRPARPGRPRPSRDAGIDVTSGLVGALSLVLADAEVGSSVHAIAPTATSRITRRPMRRSLPVRSGRLGS